MHRDFDELYYASYTSVLRAVRLLVPTSEDAHDLAQEAFTRALARWDTVSTLDNPAAWVRHVAVNAALDVTRRQRTHRRLLDRLRSRRDEPVQGPLPDPIDVVRALRTLKPDHRRAVVLHYLCDMSVDDIAAHTGRPAATVKTHLSRGRALLSELLRTEEQVSFHG